MVMMKPRHMFDDETKAYVRNLMMIYNNQFQSNCTVVSTRGMWSSGWSADFWNIQSGLIYALIYHVPLVMTRWEKDNPWMDWKLEHPWNYAATEKDHANVTCDRGDTTCYFLPYHGCGSINELKNTSVGLLEGGNVKDKRPGSRIWDEQGWIAYNFMTRQQLWLRRAVFNYKKQFRESNNIISEFVCTGVHVRRSDVTADKGGGRPYYPVEYYDEMIPEERLNLPNHNILLFTDDANAIDEAKEFFPNLKWKYFDRNRHRGRAAGGKVTPLREIRPLRSSLLYQPSSWSRSVPCLGLVGRALLITCMRT